jgi:putative transposase
MRQFAAEWGEPPSYWVIYDIVRRLPGDLLMLAHRGAKAYCDTFDLVHRREASGPNPIWQADHTPLDITGVHRRLLGQTVAHDRDR